jgi:subtilisin family serine protease
MGGGSTNALRTLTSVLGVASVQWTLSTTPGEQVVEASIEGRTDVRATFVAGTGANITGTIVDGSDMPVWSERVPRRALSPQKRLLAGRQPRLRMDRIVVTFRESQSLARLNVRGTISASRLGATRSALEMTALDVVRNVTTLGIESSPFLLAARIRVADTSNIALLLTTLRADPRVEWAERDGLMTIHDRAPVPLGSVVVSNDGFSSRVSSNGVYPNDPLFYGQFWAHNMIGTPSAWALTQGDEGVVIAVVDKGVRFDSPDVSVNLTNDGYDFVSQGAYSDAQPICGGGTFITIDGDGDGADPDPTDPDDLVYTGSCWQHSTTGAHGLWTAGILGAAGNNGAGTAGVNWRVRIRPVRVLGTTGEGSTFDIAQGILYAAGLPARGKNGGLVQTSPARIINVSLGGYEDAAVLRSAVAAAVGSGALVIASAGNETTDSPAYPASYPGVMSISAVGDDGRPASYSNAGRFISVAAPGGEFRLDDTGGGGVLGPAWNYATNRPAFVSAYGTSAAAPFVSGVAALLLAHEPGLTATEIRLRIEQSATRPRGTVRTDEVGWGIVNAYRALTGTGDPSRHTIVRLLSAETGVEYRRTTAYNGAFSFGMVANGDYLLDAGDVDEEDGVLGLIGRRFGQLQLNGRPRLLHVSAGTSAVVAMSLSWPKEQEPNDDAATANVLSVGTYSIGSITEPDSRDVFRVMIPAAGLYSFETAGVVGSCGYGSELDTVLEISDSRGKTLARNDNFQSVTSRACSRVILELQPGPIFAVVTGTTTNGLSSRGRYQISVTRIP